MIDNDFRSRYGVVESNPLVGEHPCYSLQGEATLAEVARVTRLRLLTERGYPFLDVSYCYGELADGTPVRIIDAPHRIERRNAKGELIAWAKASGKYAKGLGLLDDGVWSVLYG